MKALLTAAFSRKLAILLIFVLCLLWGLLAYINISKESTPDVRIPILYVSLEHPGISPEDAERLLVRPVEQQLKSIEGIREMRSTAYEGGGNVVLEFSAGFDLHQARNFVREKVDAAKPQLPKDVKEPTIHEVNLSLFPVLVIKLSGDIPKRTLYRIARDLKERIESTVPSVLKAEVVGKRDDVIEALINPARIQGYGLAFDDVSQIVLRNNQLIPAGNLDNGTGRFPIKVPGVFENVWDILSIPVANHEDAVIRLQDIAEVRRTFKDPENFARDRGSPAVTLEITKRVGENLIETIAAVKNIVAEQQQSWPQHLNVAFAQDQSKHIHDMLDDLQNSIILAIILVMAVMVLSLGWRSALLVGIAVPGSFLTGIMILSLLGYTVNIVVLFSLIFSVGMLVDGAIIVVEYADRRLEAGVPPAQAFLEAAIRMAWPVITSITTILVVFLPLLFWPGVVGQFMKYLPITLLLVLSASLLMALVFVPIIGSLLKPQPQKDRMVELTEHGNLDAVDGWTGQYIQLLKKCLANPGRVIMGAVFILIVVKSLHSFVGQGVEFFPDVEPDSAAVWVHGRGNLSVYEKDSLVRQVESRIFDMAELSSIYSRSGAQPRGGKDQIPEDVIGTITLEFVDWKTRRSVDAILQEVRTRTQDIAGVQIEVIKQKGGPPSLKPIQLQISTRHVKDLFPTTQRIRTLLEKTTGLVGIDDDRPLPGVAWEIAVDRAQAAKFGADVAAVGNAIKLVTNGILVGRYRPDDARDEVDILVRYPSTDRNLAQLNELRIVTPMGDVPIANFVTLKPNPKVGEIYRADGLRVVTIRADVAPGVLVADKIQDIQQGLHKLDLPEGTLTIFKGEERDRAETGQFLLKAFGIAIFLILVILLIQFNSFFSAFLVLSAVVISTVGVFVGLIIHQLPFGIVMGGIGVIALAGIIVSNNIILIDTYDHIIRGISNPTYEQYKEAILRTCAQRLRPVLLTKVTAILGLLPIMFGINIDFLHFSITKGAPATQWWILLSLCIVYGLLFASSMTLFVTPAALLARVNRRFGIKTFSRSVLFGRTNKNLEGKRRNLLTPEPSQQEL